MKRILFLFSFCLGRGKRGKECQHFISSLRSSMKEKETENRGGKGAGRRVCMRKIVGTEDMERKIQERIVEMIKASKMGRIQSVLKRRENWKGLNSSVSDFTAFGAAFLFQKRFLQIIFYLCYNKDRKRNVFQKIIKQLATSKRRNHFYK